MLDPIYEEHASLIAARVAEMLSARPAPVVPEYLNAEGASILLGISIRTLENYRVKDPGGPPFTRFRQLVRYRVEDLRKWMASNQIVPGGVE